MINPNLAESDFYAQHPEAIQQLLKEINESKGLCEVRFKEIKQSAFK